MRKTHYYPSLNPLFMKSEGVGACGKSGVITGYPGLVTCKECKHFSDADLKAMQALKCK